METREIVEWRYVLFALNTIVQPRGNLSGWDTCHEADNSGKNPVRSSHLVSLPSVHFRFPGFYMNSQTASPRLIIYYTQHIDIFNAPILDDHLIICFGAIFIFLSSCVKK